MLLPMYRLTCSHILSFLLLMSCLPSHHPTNVKRPFEFNFYFFFFAVPAPHPFVSFSNVNLFFHQLRFSAYQHLYSPFQRNIVISMTSTRSLGVAPLLLDRHPPPIFWNPQSRGHAPPVHTSTSTLLLLPLTQPAGRHSGIFQTVGGPGAGPRLY